MIIVNEISALKDWLNENRLDQESEKPYFLEIQDEDGNYQLPEDRLIEKGLSELNIDYTLITNIKGVYVELSSNDFE